MHLRTLKLGQNRQKWSTDHIRLINAYLDRTDHYLQLFYWSYVPENFGFRVKLRQSLILADFESRKISKSSREINVLRFLRYLAQS